MNKKGQVFLLAAIIMVLSLVSVSIKYNTAKEYPSLLEYQELSQNYLTEMPKILNYAKFVNEDPTSLLDGFTKSYVESAQKKDPKFGVFYAYKDEGGTVHVVNTLNNRVLNLVITKNGINPETVILKLYGEVNSLGNACISGVGCRSQESNTNEFGGEFLNVRDLEGVSAMKVCLGGTERAPTDCTDFIAEITALTESHEDVSETIGDRITYQINENSKVDVTLEEYN